MSAKVKRPISASVKSKAKQLLEFAQRLASTCQYSTDFFNAIFSPRGKAGQLFPSEKEIAEFFRTSEYKQIRELIDELPRPPVTETVNLTVQSNGHLSVTLPLPKSVHAALMQEAAAEGVTLDQLCLSKLVAQLRELV